MIKNYSKTVNEYIVNKKILYCVTDKKHNPLYRIANVWEEDKAEKLLSLLDFEEKQKLLRKLNNPDINLVSELDKLTAELEQRYKNV